MPSVSCRPAARQAGIEPVELRLVAAQPQFLRQVVTRADEACSFEIGIARARLQRTSVTSPRAIDSRRMAERSPAVKVPEKLSAHDHRLLVATASA